MCEKIILTELENGVLSLKLGSERHTVLWHQKYNLPVTTRGHNFMNPNTGLLEHANPNEIVSGPPSIDIYVHNLAAHPEESGQFSLRAGAVGTVNEVVAEIGAQVARGAYSIYSLNVSKYQVTLIIESEMRYAELKEELSGIARRATKQSFERSKKAVQDAKTIVF
ncbi:hypothetical protein B0O99DRAFT_589643 [Bisporella sp. PMI_857]|nr:hypothetical protein B0O99DRAFT_589643 [Bisporella sp. PMI_857]